MFASGPISSGFAAEVEKIVRLGPDAICRAVIHNELGRIQKFTYSGFATNKTTIELVDADHILTEVVIARRSDEDVREIFQSVAYETCLIPIVGELSVFEYPIDVSGNMLTSESVVATERDSLIFFSKTSESRAIYQVVAASEVCVLLTSTWKIDPDDYYVVYDRWTRDFIEAVSTNSKESRVQFWLTFYQAIRESMPQALIERITGEAETVKLREFLATLKTVGST
jgi:hypothetical protein